MNIRHHSGAAPARKSDIAVFWCLWLLNFLAGAGYLFLKSGVFEFFGIVGLAALWAAVGTVVLHVVQRFRMFRAILLGVMVAALSLFVVTDIFLYVKFNIVFGQQAMHLIANTTPEDTSTFAGSYLGIGTVLLLLLAVAAVAASGILVGTGMTILARRRSFGRVERVVRWGLTAVGAVYICVMAYSFVRYHSGREIPMLSHVTRTALGYGKMVQAQRKVATLRTVCASAEAHGEPRFDVVFVLGESFNSKHTPLYGYDKATTPWLSARAADSSLVVFEDVVTVADWTHKAMMGLFGTGSGIADFGSHPLFPALFRKAGYYTALYDNEYFVGMDDTFNSDRELSEILYDYRNAERMRYDADLMATVDTVSAPGLYILHLYGQHFTYADRYPEGFGAFKADDYDASKFKPEQRAMLASYDNAVLYNDSVLSQIAEKFRDRSAVMVFISDHGEEVYDCRDYFGHGNALSAPDFSPQLRVPMTIWMTDRFMAENPDKAAAIRGAASRRFTSDDMPHLLLDIADIEAPSFDPSRSIINEACDTTRRRIVMESIDFDKAVADGRASGI